MSGSTYRKLQRKTREACSFLLTLMLSVPICLGALARREIVFQYHRELNSVP